jgi:hypothetical protein
MRKELIPLLASMYKLEYLGTHALYPCAQQKRSWAGSCVSTSANTAARPIAASSPKNSTDFRYRPSQSTVDTNRPQRPRFGRCPYPQRLRFSPQMIGRACGINMGSPLELKRCKACPVRGIPFMLMLCSALVLLIHLSLPEFQRPATVPPPKVRTTSHEYIPQSAGKRIPTSKHRFRIAALIWHYDDTEVPLAPMARLPAAKPELFRCPA